MRFLLTEHSQWSYLSYYNKLDYTIIASPIEQLSYWLTNTSLLKEVYVHASEDVASWWWLENLFLFVAGTWTVFLASEGLSSSRTQASSDTTAGRRKNVPHLWAYMFIAQLVSVSTAFSLFSLALVYRATQPKPVHAKKTDDVNAVLPPSAEDLEAPLQITLPVLLGLFIVSIWPASSSPTFLPIVLALYVLLLIPSLPSPFWTIRPRALNIPVTSTYFAITALVLVLRLQSTLAVASSLPDVGLLQFAKAAINVLYTNTATAIFGWDTIWTTVVFFIWNAYSDGTTKPNGQLVFPMLSTTAALGIAFTAPMSLGNVVNEVLPEQKSKKDKELAS